VSVQFFPSRASAVLNVTVNVDTPFVSTLSEGGVAFVSPGSIDTVGEVEAFVFQYSSTALTVMVN